MLAAAATTPATATAPSLTLASSSCPLPSPPRQSITSRAAHDREASSADEGSSSPDEWRPHVSIRTRAGLEARPSAPPSETIFVGNLYFDATAQDLQDAFGQFGDIVSTRIVYDHTGVSRGFAYVQFTTRDAAAQAIEMMDYKVLLGRPINVGYARSPSQSRASSSSRSATPTRTLFIGNLPYDINDTEANRLFDRIDGITDVRIAVDRATGAMRGFAHADFGDLDSAIAARDVLLSRSVMSRPVRVEYAYGNKEGNARRQKSSSGYGTA